MSPGPPGRVAQPTVFVVVALPSAQDLPRKQLSGVYQILRGRTQQQSLQHNSTPYLIAFRSRKMSQISGLKSLRAHLAHRQRHRHQRSADFSQLLPRPSQALQTGASELDTRGRQAYSFAQSQG